MKKSLKDAMEQAQQASMAYPAEQITVLDAPGKKATYTASAWIRSERILRGYRCVAVFAAGRKQ